MFIAFWKAWTCFCSTENHLQRIATSRLISYAKYFTSRNIPKLHLANNEAKAICFSQKERHIMKEVQRKIQIFCKSTEHQPCISSAKLVAVETRTSTNTEKMQKMGTASFSFINSGQI